MDSEDKQRISLYLDKETVIKMDEAIKKYDYRSRNDFVSFAVDNLIADKLLDENDTVISEKLSRSIAEMSEKQTLQIAKSMFRYAVEMELIMRMFSEITDFTPSEIEEMRKAYMLRRNYIVKAFNDLGLHTFTPQGAFYVFPCIKSTGMTSDQFCEELLKDQLVACVPGTAFGEAGEGFIRVSYAYSIEQIKEATSRIKKFLDKLKK